MDTKKLTYWQQKIFSWDKVLFKTTAFYGLFLLVLVFVNAAWFWMALPLFYAMIIGLVLINMVISHSIRAVGTKSYQKWVKTWEKF